MKVTPLVTYTVLPTSALPTMEGVAELVMPSLDDAPGSGLIPVINGAVGAVLSTVIVALNRAAETFPARSTAAPAGIERLKVPSPVIEEIVMVRLLVLLVVTDTVPLAVPVLFRLI